MKKERFFAMIFICSVVLLFGCAKDEDKRYSVIVSGTGGTTEAFIGSVAVTKAEVGATVTLTATADLGYEFLQWEVESGGITLLPDATTTPVTFTMPAADVSVKAIFNAQYIITVTEGGNGSALADKDEAEAGATITLTATAADGYEFSQWEVESGDVILLPDAMANPVTFIMPAADVSIKAIFTVPEYEGVLINGIWWSEFNVSEPGTFTAKVEDYGMIYQWNRKSAWSPVGETVEGWNSVNVGEAEDVWEADNDPCPSGWRIPTNDEQQTLVQRVIVGSEWTTVNGVNGRKYFEIEFPENSIFIPTPGYRRGSDSMLQYPGVRACYWTASSDGSDERAWYFNIRENTSGLGGFTRNTGGSIRCIRVI